MIKLVAILKLRQTHRVRTRNKPRTFIKIALHCLKIHLESAVFITADDGSHSEALSHANVTEASSNLLGTVEKAIPQKSLRKYAGVISNAY